MTGTAEGASASKPDAFTAAVPAAKALRIPWPRLPIALREAVESFLGSVVLAATSQIGGFSSGAALRLICADGSRAFLKAIPSHGDSYALWLYDKEVRIAAELPDAFPAPRFQGRVEGAGWIGLVFDDVEGQTVPVPWSSENAGIVIHEVIRLNALATPCPVPGLVRWGGRVEDWRGWRYLVENKSEYANVSDWCMRNAPRLIDLEQSFPDAADGNTLVHSDLRSDNIILGAKSVSFVDWAWAACGQAWIDPLIFSLYAAVQGMPDPDQLFHTHPSARSADPDAVNSVLAALAGRLLTASQEETPPKPAGLSEFQRLEARIAIDWLASRTGWK